LIAIRQQVLFLCKNFGTRKPIQYEVVKEVEEEFDYGGVRELDYFGGTNLAFVDYIQPREIVQKGFLKNGARYSSRSQTFQI